MSHGITTTDTAWFHNTPAWHGLGTVATKRPKTAREWVKLAGLDWPVEIEELVTMGSIERALRSGKDLTGRQLFNRLRDHAIPDLRATVRADNHEVLGVVSDEYTALQNQEVFAFLESLMGQTVAETAFSLYGGKQVGALSRIPTTIEIGGDETRTYIYARWRHDGTGALWIFPTNVRVVCANTDRAAIEDAGGPDGETIHKILHRGDKTMAIHEARAALQMTVNATKQLKKLGDRLARQKVSDRQLNNVMDQLYPSGIGVEGGPTTTRQQKTRLAAQQSVREIFLTSDTQGNSPGTKWCLYQAIIEHNQHHRSVRAKDPQLAAERKFMRSFEDPEGLGKMALSIVQEA